MELLDSPLIPNLLYLTLVFGLWFAALAIVTPGTGIYESLAFVALLLTGVGTFFVPLNLWALIPLGVGLVAFGVSFWRKKEGLLLAAAALCMSLGSMYLFRSEAGGPAVYPALALVTSIFTLGFFWLTIRQAIRAMRGQLSVDPLAVIGMVGEVRTPIDPMGSVYVGGELWTAQADQPIPEGAQVKVVDREGLVVTVEIAGEAGSDLASEKGA